MRLQAAPVLPTDIPLTVRAGKQVLPPILRHKRQGCECPHALITSHPRWQRVLLCLLMVLAPLARAEDAPPLKVLFIGNSFTYYNRMPDILAAMSRAPGSVRAIEVRTVVQGGASLLQHWEARAARRAIHAERWNAVVLQEESRGPLERPERMAAYAKRFVDEINKADARPLLFITWARKDSMEKHAEIGRVYRSVAKETGADIAPVGPVWHATLTRSPELSLYDADGHHPGPLGSYLAACVFYLALLPEARQCPALGAMDQADADAALVREVAVERRERRGK